MILERKVNKAVNIWTFLVGLISFGLGFTFIVAGDFASLAIAYIVLMGTYYLGLFLIEKFIVWQITNNPFLADQILKELQYAQIQQINAGLADGTLQPGPELDEHMKKLNMGEVMTIMDLGPVCGSYKDFQIHEWISIKQSNGEETRFNFHSAADISKNGVINLPDAENKKFIILNEIVYEHIFDETKSLS